MKTPSHRNFYNFVFILVQILTVLAFIGVQIFAKPRYVELLQQFIQIYITGFLILRFNPITGKGTTFDDFDRKIAFNSGLFLFTAMVPDLMTWMN
jgi:hypothetical protein